MFKMLYTTKACYLKPLLLTNTLCTYNKWRARNTIVTRLERGWPRATYL